MASGVRVSGRFFWFCLNLRCRSVAEPTDLPQSWPKGDRSVEWYKAAELFAPILLPYLDQKHDEQVRSGAITLNEKGMTEEKYPF